MKFKTKSQVFFFDMLLSAIFLMIAIGIIYSLKMVDSENSNVYNYANNLMDYFFNTEINDLNENVVVQLFKDNLVRDIHANLAQQIAYFYFEGLDGYADNLTKGIVLGNLPKNMNINITINNTVLYYKRNNVKFKDAKTVYGISRVVFGYYNSTKIYGPYNFKIVIWQ